jgi:transposase
MSDEIKEYTKEQLQHFSNSLLVEMVYTMQQQIAAQNRKLDELTEYLNTHLDHRFGRRTEKLDQIDHQMEFCFNEAEITIVDASEAELREPEIEDINPSQPSEKKTSHNRKPREVGKLDELLKPFSVVNVPHKLDESELQCKCGGTYTEIGKKTYRQLAFHPASFEVEEHTVYTYKCNSCGSIITAPHPIKPFDKSVASPSLLAGIMTAKYVNAVTFMRLEKTFSEHSALLTRQKMAHWMINVSDLYFSQIYDCLKQDLLTCNVVHADETTVKVAKDGRPAGSTSYMWVYTKEADQHPVVIFEYQKTRAHIHAKEFLENYHGFLCCDGYDAYHHLGESIVICGCWAHARRHFANAVKALQGKPAYSEELKISEEALQRIASLFRKDNQWKDLSEEEHLLKRTVDLKKDLDDYFNWIRKQVESKKARPKSETGKGLTYSLNQEVYLRGFISNAQVPLDNSEAERKIRNFVISRKNFVMIDSLAGAQSSAVLFSMAETAKANDLKPYAYFEYILQVLPQHRDDPEDQRRQFIIDNLLPWSPNLPEYIRKS